MSKVVDGIIKDWGEQIAPKRVKGAKKQRTIRGDKFDFGKAPLVKRHRQRRRTSACCEGCPIHAGNATS